MIDVTHFIIKAMHRSWNPILVKQELKNSHSTCHKLLAYRVSRQHNFFFLLLRIYSWCRTSWTITTLFWIWRPLTKALHFVAISMRSHGFSQLVNTVAIILQLTLHKLIGRNWLTFSQLGTSGIRETRVMFRAGSSFPIKELSDHTEDILLENNSTSGKIVHLDHRVPTPC